MSNLFSLQDDNDGFGLSGDDLFNVVSGGDDPFLDELGSPPLTTFTVRKIKNYFLKTLLFHEYK